MIFRAPKCIPLGLLPSCTLGEKRGILAGRFSERIARAACSFESGKTADCHKSQRVIHRERRVFSQAGCAARGSLVVTKCIRCVTVRASCGENFPRGPVNDAIHAKGRLLLCSTYTRRVPLGLINSFAIRRSGRRGTRQLRRMIDARLTHATRKREDSRRREGETHGVFRG